MNEEQLRNQINKLNQQVLSETNPAREKQIKILIESLVTALEFETRCNEESEETDSEEEGLEIISVDEETEEESG